MSAAAISVEALSKEYTVRALQRPRSTLYDVLAHALSAPFGGGAKSQAGAADADQFWALSDVAFEVAQGDVLGIIGRNGAGKSTLLKILSRITAPTRGRVTMRGRLASLLEVGTGFHPELSGRENVYLNGALLGMTKSDIARKFDGIVDFAEIDKFIDTPVKRYSSGMYVRLAFSVAAHLEPDILVIDEVLAVGDAEFQRKCLGKLEDSHTEGRTVIVVSHNMSMITQLCRSALWLDQGRLVKQGSVQDVASSYLSAKRMRSTEWMPADDGSPEFRYEAVSIIAPLGSSPDSVAAGETFGVEFRYAVRSDDLSGRLSLLIRNQEDLIVLTSANTDGQPFLNRKWERGSYVETCEIPGHLLVPGIYYVTISQPTKTGNLILEDICKFEVSAKDSLCSRDGRQGVIAPLLVWRR